MAVPAARRSADAAGKGLRVQMPRELHNRVVWNHLRLD